MVFCILRAKSEKKSRKNGLKMSKYNFQEKMQLSLESTTLLTGYA